MVAALAAPVYCVQHYNMYGVTTSSRQSVWTITTSSTFSDAELSAEQNIVTAAEYDNPCVLP